MIRTPDVITKQIQELNSMISSTKKAIQDNLNDPQTSAMEFMIEQANEQKARLEKEIEESLAHYKQNTLKLAFDTELARMPVHIVADILKSLDSLFDTISGALGIHDKFPTIELRTVYHGSFGLLMSTKPTDKLFLDDIDRQIDVVFQSFESLLSDNASSVTELLNHNKKALSKLKSMIDKIENSGYDIKLEWIDTQKRKRDFLLPHDKSTVISKILNDAIEEITKDIIIKDGKIVAIDFDTKTIKIKYTKKYKTKSGKEKTKKPTLTIKIQDRHKEAMLDKLDKIVNVKLFEKSIYNSITEKIDTKYEFVEFI